MAFALETNLSAIPTCISDFFFCVSVHVRNVFRTDRRTKPSWRFLGQNEPCKYSHAAGRAPDERAGQGQDHVVAESPAATFGLRSLYFEWSFLKDLVYLEIHFTCNPYFFFWKKFSQQVTERSAVGGEWNYKSSENGVICWRPINGWYPFLPPLLQYPGNQASILNEALSDVAGMTKLPPNWRAACQRSPQGIREFQTFIGTWKT